MLHRREQVSRKRGPISLAPACLMLQDGGARARAAGAPPCGPSPALRVDSRGRVSPPSLLHGPGAGEDTRRRREECAYALEATHLARGLGLKSEHASQCEGSYKRAARIHRVDAGLAF